MTFEWDENKRLLTLAIRGLDFERAIRIFDDVVVEWDSPRNDESRVVAVGRFDGDYLTVVYTWRGDRRRIITARAARRSERERYDRSIGTGHQG